MCIEHDRQCCQSLERINEMNTQTNTQEFKVNQLVLVEGYLAVITHVYDRHVGVKIAFHGKVVKTVVEKSKCKPVQQKARYTKDEQHKMFGRVFSVGFIQLNLVNFDSVNAWGLVGQAVHMYTARKVDALTLHIGE